MSGSLFKITDLSKTYKNANGRSKAIEDISFSVSSGEIVALIGKNGAGKTTILNCIANNIKTDTGSIYYKNRNLLTENSLLSEFGILIQANFFSYLNAADNLSLLMLASGFRDKELIDRRINSVLALVGLEDKKRAYINTFSFGMKQRLGLAQALLANPQFLILDEPFVGLDPYGKDILKNLILQKAKEEKLGILFSSHDLTDVSQLCDRIIMIDNGKKIYDDKFENTKKYIFLTDKEMSKENIVIIEDNLNCKIKVSCKALEFYNQGVIEAVFDILKSLGIRVVDIQVEESSLNDFFKVMGNSEETGAEEVML